MQKKGMVIDPRQVKIMAKWDLTMVMALFFTALVTPVEVVFLQEGSHINALWIINRVVDLLFVFDIFFTFHLAFQESQENGGHWVINKDVIVWNYLKGWVRASSFPGATITPLDDCRPYPSQVARAAARSTVA